MSMTSQDLWRSEDTPSGPMVNRVLAAYRRESEIRSDSAMDDLKWWLAYLDRPIFDRFTIDRNWTKGEVDHARLVLTRLSRLASS